MGDFERAGEHVAQDAERVVADGDHREALDRGLQAELALRRAGDGVEHRLVLDLEIEPDADIEQLDGALDLVGERLEALLDGKAGGERGVDAVAEIAAEGRAERGWAFAQALEASLQNSAISLRGGEAVAEPLGQLAGADRQPVQSVERRLDRFAGRGTRQRFDQRRQIAFGLAEFRRRAAGEGRASIAMLR